MMNPTTYCREAIEALRQQRGSFSAPAGQQVVVILSTYGQQGLSAQDFAMTLNLLAESSERSGRAKVAAAAREILAGWQSRSATR
jgi:hypothetical protein